MKTKTPKDTISSITEDPKTQRRGWSAANGVTSMMASIESENNRL